MKFTKNEIRTILEALELYKSTTEESLDCTTNDDEVEFLKSDLSEIKNLLEKVTKSFKEV